MQGREGERERGETGRNNAAREEEDKKREEKGRGGRKPRPVQRLVSTFS